MEFKLEDGKELIKFARSNIENYLKTGYRIEISPHLKEKYKNHGGAFVTLHKRDGNLRGCIGIILPIYPLIETIHNVSISSAVEDPRFSEVKLSEMENIIIEISVLTVPEKIIVNTSEEYLRNIVIGRDGLIISRGGRKGLLLPQVATEYQWDVKTFLEHTCQKAWLSPEAWKDLRETTVEKFSAIIFTEITPNGDIQQKEIS